MCRAGPGCGQSCEKPAGRPTSIGPWQAVHYVFFLIIRCVKHLQVKHLGAVSSMYDVATWERDRAANEKVMQRLRMVRGPSVIGCTVCCEWRCYRYRCRC